ncbi:MAG: MATE family efflux transporter, partial [Verrucomicrobiales bacterium]
FTALLQLGTPVAFQHLLEMGVFALGAFMMGWIHADALAAHQIAFTCASTTFMFSLSLGMAASIRVGQALGAGEVHRVRRIGFLAMGHTVLIMSTFAIVVLMQGPTLAGWFVDSVKVTTLAVQLLTVAAAFQVFDGLQVVAICILRGMQDVRITAPLGYVLAFVAGMGAMGIWIGFASGLAVAAMGLIGRFHLLAVRDASQ